MPLPPNGNTPWPPPYLKPALDQMNVLAAWWEGDPDKLSAVYGGTAETAATSEHSFERRGSYRGGVVGALQRWFWGQQTAPQQQRSKVHVPIAAEIAAASADLLFSQPLQIVWGDEDKRRSARDAAVAAAQAKADAAAPPNPINGEPGTAAPVDAPDVPPDPAQLRFDQLRESSGLDSTLLEAAEVCAAMSGVYLRLCVDQTLQDGPWVDIVHPDSAVPEFSHGRLRAVTFWQDLTDEKARKSGKVLRHLERHEPGRILHGLYEGGQNTLGSPIPLAEAPVLAGLAASLENGNEIATVPGRLTAVFVPNMRPAPQWRRSSQLAPLGRSDYTPGVLGMMDRLDEVMSSWMRDIRLAKARIQVPEQYLENQGRGQGAVFDVDKEIYTTLNMLPQPGGAPQINAVQFKIRVDEHQRTAQWLLDQIVRAAGYSTQTLGSDGDGTAATATEINAREKRSILTRDKKSRYWDCELTQLFWTWLLLDATLPNPKTVEGAAPMPASRAAPISPDGPPEVTFPPIAQADPLSLAQTAQAMFAAAAASKHTLVALLHPTWDEDQIQQELARIAEDAEADQPPAPEDLGTEQPLAGAGPAGYSDGTDQGYPADQNPDDNYGIDEGDRY